MYCPFISEPVSKYLPDGNTIQASEDHAWKILFGGDQLTCARASGATNLRSGHDDVKDQLTGLTSVIEDWHARQTLLKVCKHKILI